MSKQKMWLVIITMALSLLGITIIQYIWFAQAVDQDEKNFSDRISIALGIVKDRLYEDAHKTDNIKDYLKYKNLSDKRYNTYKKLLSFKSKNLDKQQLQLDFFKTEMLVNPQGFLEGIDKKKLKTYIGQEFNAQGIKLDYEFGIFSNQSNSFIIINDNYVATIGNSSQSSDIETGQGLYNSNYRIPLFETDKNVPGALTVYFPNKRTYLWSSVMPSLLTSILFIALVMSCFGYVLYVIQRQKKVSEMKTDFINNMTHEFKTPIATISLASDSINSPMIINNEEKIRKFTGIIGQENKRMLNQVEKVLQMAMLEKEDFELKLGQVDMKDVIETAVENVGLKVAQRGGTIETDFRASSHIVEGDQNHLSNIIHNLLDNAEKYSPEELQIKVKTENTKDGLLISISDKGLGMKKEDVKQIFDKFYRVHTGNIHNVKGFGLGLSYVKAIVDAHGGELEVKSNFGEGSTFIVKLKS